MKDIEHDFYSNDSLSNDSESEFKKGSWDDIKIQAGGLTFSEASN